MIPNRRHGFTLIELLIAVTVLGALTLLSVGFYGNYVRQARRGDATETLASISLAEERYRTSNSTYGSLAQVWNSVSTTPGGYYNLSISNTSGTAYTITATAIGNQANDNADGVSCGTLTLSVSNGAVTKSPSVCWPQ